MFINRSWLELSHGEKMAVLEYARWKTDQRWEVRVDEKKNSHLAG